MGAALTSSSHSSTGGTSPPTAALADWTIASTILSGSPVATALEWVVFLVLIAALLGLIIDRSLRRQLTPWQHKDI
jgi:hypothetical protein